ASCSVSRARAGSSRCVPAPRTTRTGRRSGWRSQVTCPDGGSPLRLEISQERADKGCIQIAERQGRWRLAELRLCEREQQPECIPVGSDRVGADVALAHEPLCEVALD